MKIGKLVVTKDEYVVEGVEATKEDLESLKTIAKALQSYLKAWEYKPRPHALNEVECLDCGTKYCSTCEHACPKCGSVHYKGKW